MRISCIHPSRSRPEQAIATARKWIAKAGVPVEYIMSVDYDDPRNSDYFELDIKVVAHSNRSCVDAINNAVQYTGGDLLVVVSDDFDCPENWGADLLKHLEGKKDFAVKVNDGHQPVIITLPIMDRTYYNRFGYIYCPDYFHMFCDTHMTAVAHLLGRVVEVPMLFPHNHHVWDRSIKADELNKRNDATFQSGKRIYMNRIKDNFGLKAEDIVGTIPESINVKL